MDCKSARTLLDFAQPRGFDLATEERAALEAHLAECSECDCLARAERLFDAHVGKAIRGVPVPVGLKERLLTKLRRERDDWWKQWANRGLRYSLAAAAIFLVTWGVFLWNASQLDPVTDGELEQEVLTAYEYSPPSPEEVEKWFEKKGKKVKVPREYNYRFLTCYNLTEFKGREVPHLLFVRSYPNSAEVQTVQVYILSDRQFNLSELTGESHPPAGYRVQVKIEPRASEAYVIAFTGNLDKLKQEPE